MDFLLLPRQKRHFDFFLVSFFTYWLPSTVIFSSMNSVKMEWPRIRKNNTQIEVSNDDDEISIAFVHYYQNSAKLIYFYDILISRLYSINLTDFHECVGGKKREWYRLLNSTIQTMNREKIIKSTQLCLLIQNVFLNGKIAPDHHSKRFT